MRKIFVYGCGLMVMAGLIFVIAVYAVTQEIGDWGIKKDNDSPTIDAPDDLPFVDWVHSGSNYLGTNIYSDEEEAVQVGEIPDEYYVIQPNGWVNDTEAGQTPDAYLQVDLYHRTAFDLTSLDSASWEKIGSNSSLYSGGADPEFSEGCSKTLHYTSVYRHQWGQWKIEARNFTGWSAPANTPTPFDTETSVRIHFGATATPTPIPSTPTPTNTPTATPTDTPTPTPTNTPTATPTPDRWISWMGAGGTKYNHALVHGARKVSGGTYVETTYTDYYLRVYPNPTPNEVGIHLQIGSVKYVSRPDKTGDL